LGSDDTTAAYKPDERSCPIAIQATQHCYLSELNLTGDHLRAILPCGWALVATADFNGDAIWYLNNNIYIDVPPESPYWLELSRTMNEGLGALF
jgi:hypothetical protein